MRDQIGYVRPNPTSNPSNSFNHEALTLSHIYCDRDFLLSEDSSVPPGNISKVCCPEIILNINNKKVNALIDSGSNITCMSYEWFTRHKEQLGHFEELPLTNIHIKTALGSKSKRISHIILVQANICNQPFNLQCILVPNLLRPVILGVDTMSMLEMEINFKENNATMNLNNECISIKFEDVSKDGIKCNIIERSHVNDDLYSEENDSNMFNNDLIVHNPEDMLEDYPPMTDEEIFSENLVRRTIQENNQLNLREQEKLIHLILEYQHIFSNQPGRCNKYAHPIEVTNHQSFKCQTYPVPLKYQDAVAKEIERMEQENIIERSRSPYVNPIIPVIKKTGEIRLCLDARKINEIITPDYECNRSVNELLAKGKDSKFLSTIDLTASYWQIELTPASRQYTAFQFRGQTWQYVVTPFGISTSQAALVRALDQVFGNEIEDFSLVYVDDICAMSSDFTMHLTHLEHIFKKLSDANMTVKFTKSSFCRNNVPFLGYVLTTNGLEMDQSRVKAILDFPIPQTRKQLKSFLGCINYYNKFLDKYAQAIQPLLRLTSKNVKFDWTSEDTKTFDQIKHLFIHTNVLHHPNPKAEYYLQTDASDVAIAGHLYQLDHNNEKKAIVFLSRTLQPAEQRFTTTEKELLAIVHCLQKVRYIILGSRLNVITDNHAITFLKTCRLLNARLTRWILAIQDYNFNIVHCKGSDNPVADTLSRLCPTNREDPSNHSEELVVSHIQRIQDPDLQNELINLPHHQENDPRLNSIYNIFEDQPINQNHAHLIKTYKLHQSILYKKFHNHWLIALPECLIDRMIWECHNYYLHCGAKKCLTLLQECFIFKNMGRRIRTTLKTCDSCQRCKINPHPNHGVAKGINCREKNDQIAIDIIGPLPTSVGNVKYILIALDIFTKFVKLYPIRSANTRSIINKLFGIHFLEYGLPSKIQSDNGSQFKSRAWLKKLEDNNITPIFSPVYYPRFNMSERPIKEVKRCLRTYCAHQHRNWARAIPIINSCLNEVHHETTGFTPNEIQLGQKDTRFWEQHIVNPFISDMPLERKLFLTSQRIRNKQLRRAARYNARHRPTVYNVGDLVLARSHHLSNAIGGETAKLFEVYDGPYRISQKLGETTYFLSNINRHNQLGPYHISSLKLYHPPNQI